MSSNIKNIIIAIVAVVAMFFGYKYFFVSAPTPDLKVEGSSSASTQAGKDFLVALINLQHINLDAGAVILNDPTFVRLRDMSVSLPDEPHGRGNPFRAIGDDSGSAVTATQPAAKK